MNTRDRLQLMWLAGYDPYEALWAISDTTPIHQISPMGIAKLWLLWDLCATYVKLEMYHVG